MMRGMEEALSLNNFTKCFVVAMALFGSQSTYADQHIDDSNCMQYLGGGGLGDFDCYEHHAKSIEADNRRVAIAIKSTHGIKGTSKVELDRYMRTQDEAVQVCGLASKLAYDWNIEKPPKKHVDMYDVMEARCHYSIRKEQNNFLHDLYSIKTGE